MNQDFASALGEARIPWIDIGNAGIEWPYEVDGWLRRDVPGWKDQDVDYQVYLVPEDDYRPLTELRVRAVQELRALDFLATEEELTSIRQAIERQNRSDSGG